MSRRTPGPKLNGMIISDTAIRQPVFITMLMLLVLVIGLLSYATLPVNLLPDISIPTIAVSAEGSRSPLQLRKLVDDTIAPQLQRVTGVGSVTVSGGQVRQINVQMDLNKLKALQILPAQITHAIQAANSNLGLGSISA